MKIYIGYDKSNEKNCDGFELRIVDDEGQTTVKPITRKDKQMAGNYCYRLPDNPFNVKWISDRRICDGLELGYKEPSIKQQMAKQPLEDFLDGTEKETYLRLKKLAEDRREEYLKKEQSPEAKLRAEIEKMQKKLEAMLAKK